MLWLREEREIKELNHVIQNVLDLREFNKKCGFYSLLKSLEKFKVRSL